MPRSNKQRSQAPVTLTSIAQRVGVSKASVSTVLNNLHLERRIPPATVEKIRAAATELGYLPNISARLLRRRTGTRKHVVIAWITSFEAPLKNNIPLGLLAALAAYRPVLGDMNCSILIEMFAAGRLQELPGLLTGEHFNAAIVTNTGPEDDRFLLENRLPYPVVLVNRQIPGYECVVEEPTGGMEAASLLINARRQRLAVLHGYPLTQVAETRVNSFMREVQSRLSAPASEIVAHDLSLGGACEAMNHFLERGGRVDGLYAATDELAHGAYYALKQRRLRIPQDVSVVGVGDLEFSNFSDPPLSTIGVPQRAVSERACGLLLRQLTQSTPKTPAIVVLPLQKILRASIAEFVPETAAP